MRTRKNLPPGRQRAPKKPRVKRFWDALGNRRASPTDMIHWAMNNAKRPIKTIASDEPPCYGAIPLLQLTYTDEGFAMFVRDIWSKTIPNRATQESEERFRDDGRQSLEFLARMEEELLSETRSPQEPAGESALPPETS
jgi:hypothetical protein